MAAAQKKADDRTALAEQKLASIGQLEEENAKMKSALGDANKEVTRLKKDKVNLNEKMEGIARRRDDLESYLRSLAKKLFIKLEGTHFVLTDVFGRLSIRKLTYPWTVNAEFCQNFKGRLGRLSQVWTQSILP